ncbi:hypothetical protein SDC9_196738 [bioreactor metagenome]|uniref:Uncharacterized protein n=1 Tax=bioreactor metagenome TaxID=1076179 RepID=A0A645ICV1_9ZZZZ
MRSRLEGRSRGKERPFPVCRGGHVVHRAVVVAGGHRQQVAEAETVELRVELLQQFVGKQLNETRVE